jgi:hypothetical protein
MTPHRAPAIPWRSTMRKLWAAFLSRDVGMMMVGANTVLCLLSLFNGELGWGLFSAVVALFVWMSVPSYPGAIND